MRQVISLLMLGAALGCGGTRPQPASTERFIPREQWQRMPIEERHDPYTLQHLQEPLRPPK